MGLWIITVVSTGLFVARTIAGMIEMIFIEGGGN